MRRIILLLIAAGVALAIAWVIAGLPGEVSARIGPYDIKAAAPVAALGALILFFLAYWLVRLIGMVLRSPRAWRRSRAGTRRRHGDQAVTRALVALAAGDVGGARREALRARRLLGDTPQVLLLAAEAGKQAGRDVEEEAAFRALAGRKDAALLGLRGLLRRAVEREDWREAAKLARLAEQAHPGATALRGERWRLAIRTGNWREALSLAGPDAPKAVLAAAAADAEPDSEQAMRLAKQGFEADPSLVPAALAYARRLRATGKEKRAEEAIRRAWQAGPQPELAEFLLQPITDKLARVKAAASLVKSNPDHLESHLLLARAELDAGLTGEARRHAEAAKVLAGQRRVFLLLADIAEAEGVGGDAVRAEASRLAQRTALRDAADAGPDPAWHCGACGARHARWQPVCQHCQTPGRLAWTAPPDEILLSPVPGDPAALSVR